MHRAGRESPVQNRVGLYDFRREVFGHLGKRVRFERFKRRMRLLIAHSLNNKADGFEAKRLYGVRNTKLELGELHTLSGCHGLYLGWQLAERQFVKRYLVAGIVDINSNQVPTGIVIQHNTLGYLPAVYTRPLKEVDVERVRVGMVRQLQDVMVCISAGNLLSVSSLSVTLLLALSIPVQVRPAYGR